MSIEKKVKVADFIKKYTGYKSNDAKKNYLISIVETHKYVDYLVKVKYVRDILAVSCFDESGNIKIDSCKKYILYINTILTLYTKLDIPENFMSVYDELDKNELIKNILDVIPESELKTFNTILQMCQDDMFTNNYEMHSFINNNISELRSVIVEVATPIIKTLDDKLKELTTEEILKNIIDLVKQGD